MAGSAAFSVVSVHVCAIISHVNISPDKTSPVPEVFLAPPRYNTEISPVERRKTARIRIINTFKIFFLAVMIISK
jgi:hypothetical protein